MGSMGSLGQTAGSDMDFWLCYSGDIDERGRRLLRHKAALLENRAAEVGLHAHFFLMHAESFRDGAPNSCRRKAAVTHPAHTAARRVLPHRDPDCRQPGAVVGGAAGTRARLHALYATPGRKALIRPQQWLDFGGLQTLPAEEFFGVAHWQLFKGIDAPYKSLLKLMLLEAYAAEYPNVDWLCMETKRAVYSGDDRMRTASTLPADPATHHRLSGIAQRDRATAAGTARLLLQGRAWPGCAAVL